jgi:hypothetical protein
MAVTYRLLLMLPHVWLRPSIMTVMLAGPVLRQRLARSIRCAPVLAVSLR